MALLFLLLFVGVSTSLVVVNRGETFVSKSFPVCSQSSRPPILIVRDSHQSVIHVHEWNTTSSCTFLDSTLFPVGESLFVDDGAHRHQIYVPVTPAGWLGHSVLPVGQMRAELIIPELVREAVLSFSALGYGEFEVNGVPVDSTRILDPAWTDFSVRVMFAAFNVTSMIQKVLFFSSFDDFASAHLSFQGLQRFGYLAWEWAFFRGLLGSSSAGAARFCWDSCNIQFASCFGFRASSVVQYFQRALHCSRRTHLIGEQHLSWRDVRRQETFP